MIPCAVLCPTLGTLPPRVPPSTSSSCRLKEILSRRFRRVTRTADATSDGSINGANARAATALIAAGRPRAHRLTTGTNAAGDNGSSDFVLADVPSDVLASMGLEGRSRDSIARMGHRLGCTGDPGRSSASAASVNSANRNGCNAGYRLKNSNPVTMRLLAPPAAGACVLPYPHILVTKLAYASVAPLRTSQCGDLNPRTQTSTPRETNAVVSVAISVTLNA
mmetsp:Transcript_11992/g.33178  ORF Transcript_11992/g.33178 Transcript_11992/m.33178 type:complete len:222 (-) Transcript_11992:606-1271(-)